MKVNKNMGKTDRTLRAIFALAVAVLYFTNTITGTVALVLGILAVVFFLTSMISVCPLYRPFKFSTNKE